MSNDSFTEVSSTSWTSRLGNALKGIIVGIIMVLVAIVLVFWNEGRAVKRHKTLEEGRGAVVSILADTVDVANKGSLVHLSALATTEEQLTDESFGISRRAIKLQRIAEMYQWQQESHSEEKKKLGGGTETVTTYTYSKIWSENPIHSNQFKQSNGHKNPTNMPYRSEDFVAGQVTIGAFNLPPSIVKKISGYTPLTLAPEYTLPGDLKIPARLEGHTIYLGESSQSPEIGDLKISFREIKPMRISLVAQQVGTQLKPFQTKAGGTIVLLQSGEHSAEAMFEQAHKTNTILTWILRAVGLVLMLIGFQLILSPFSVFADVLPALGNLVGTGTGLIAGLIATCITLLTMAIAWVFYRPVIGAIMLIISGGIVAFLVAKLRKGQASPQAVPPPPPPEKDRQASDTPPPPLNNRTLD